MKTQCTSKTAMAILVVQVAVSLIGCTSSMEDRPTGAALRTDTSAYGDASTNPLATGGAATAVTGTSPPTPASASMTDGRAALASMATMLSADSSAGSGTYRVGPFDVIDVEVFQVPDLSKTVQVSEVGSITYPLVGEVPVTGKSPRQIEQILATSLNAKYVRDPQVNVLVKEYNSQRVTVQGSVKSPGIFPIRGQLSLLQAMALAGGLDSASSDDQIVIFRTVNGRAGAARYTYSQVQNGATPDPGLQAGDIVVAGKSAFKEGFGMVMKALPLASVFTLL